MQEYTREEQIATALARSFGPEDEFIVATTNNLGMVGVALAQRLYAPRMKMHVNAKGRGALLGHVRVPFATGEPSDELIETAFNMKEIFETIHRGKWSMLMQPVQIDSLGNTNLLLIGDKKKPSRIFLGPRGLPDNTVNGARVDYVIPDHNTRVFVENVDFICGIGEGPAREQGIVRWKAQETVFSNLGVFDFDEATGRMRVKSLYTDVTIEQVIDNTGFELVIPDPVPKAELPTKEELQLLREEIDPLGTARLDLLKGDARKELLRQIRQGMAS